MESGLRSRISGWMKAHVPTGLAGAAFWLAVWFCLLLALSRVPGGFGTFFGVMEFFVGVALGAVALALAWQMVRKHMLWSLRNKLVLTYLLIGLAPVVLFITLVLISAYIAAGQFAIHLADTRLQSEVEQMSVENSHRADLVAGALNGQLPASASSTLPVAESAQLDTARTRMHQSSESFVDGVQVSLGTDVEGKVPLGLPPWATMLSSGEFHGLVLDGHDVYLVALNQQKLKDGRMFTLMSSVPVDESLMNGVASGLGRAVLFPLTIETTGNSRQTSGAAATPRVLERTRRGERADAVRDAIAGGNEPAGMNVADIRVRFPSTVAMTDWDTGGTYNVAIAVDSRPSLLYRQLFGASLGGMVTSVIRIGLVVLCVVLALIEMLALWMAVRLSRTITASVADLYQATKEIDRGALHHRIGVERTDQLAELSRSFNKMAESLERLLVEQKEKERLQNEISIAQEVQANLFPRQVRDLPTLELHGICRPARSVSGDYYDFLVFHRPNASDGRPGPECGVGIALGDISGKGISAALLMATLHSAVRAYQLSGMDFVQSGAGTPEADEGKLFESPGGILALLNRHLYRSTQAAKYATLFLAHYDADTAELTYSNAGHLPPIVMSRDGRIRRLDCGGTVVGLMDGMKYDEETIRMTPGDIVIGYSDGISEPENDFGEFGEERLLEVVSRYRDQPLHVISAQVMLALEAWIGAGEQPDDITLVLARQV